MSGEQVDFVDYQNDGHLFARHLIKKRLIFGGRLHHIGHIEQHIGINQCAGGIFEHTLLEFEFGCEHARSVGKHDLVIVGVHDAHNAVASGLRLAGDDGEAFAHQNVAEGGLPHIRVAHNIHESCFMLVGSHIYNV